MNEPLGRHVNGWSNVNILEVLFGKFGEPKICNFSSSIMQKYISHFKIPMDNIFLSEIKQPWKNVFDYRLRTLFRKMVLSPQFALQIPTIADFSNYIAVSIRSKYFIASKNIGMVQFFEYVNLRKK